MAEFAVNKIGTVHAGNDNAYIQLEQDYAPALAGIQDFRHLNILWWFDRCDDPENRGTLLEPSPYRTGPESLGVFATRSPRRPNPIALSCVEITYVDEAAGQIGIAWIDAENGTPVLDIKPYTPSLDRLERPVVPDWCRHWPASIESSGDFDWEAELHA